MLTEKDKRFFMTIGAILLILLFIVIGIIVFSLSEKNNTAYYDTPVSTEMDYLPLENQPILLNEEDEYRSLYGTGTFAVSDEVFNEFSLRFYGSTLATEEDLKKQLVSLRNDCRSGFFDDAFYSLQSFSETYSIQDNPLSRELVSFYQFLYSAKDVEVFDKTDDYDSIRTIMNMIDDPELFLILTMTLNKPYMFYLDYNSICLNTIVGIEGTGVLLPPEDAKYEEAMHFLSATPLAVYQYTLRYNNSMNMYAYVVTDNEGNHHVLSINNEDGSSLSPIEQQAGTEFSGYDKSKGEGFSFESIEDSTENTSSEPQEDEATETSETTETTETSEATVTNE